MDIGRRAMRIIGVVLIGYVTLCATHLGEFWPFSIFPMFSQAGHPWTRAVVREVPPAGESEAQWRPSSLSQLPGKPFRLVSHGIFQNDLANYVSKTADWSSERVKGMRAMFDEVPKSETHLLVMRVQGRLAEDSVAVQAMPLARITPDTVQLHPDIRDDYP